jgi:transposase
MVIVGIDAHKHTHTAVAVDEVGRRLATNTVRANTAGHLELIGWASQFEARSWAVEDCRHVSGRLERDLIAAGERLVRVPPKLMAKARRPARTRGKSDPIDALSVARAALREPNLPTAWLDPQSRDVRLLLDHREDLVAERTRLMNRLRWHLHELDPDYEVAPRTLDRFCVLDALDTHLAAFESVVADLARALTARCRELNHTIRRLETDITRRVTPLATQLLTLHGCGPLTAAKIIGETADVRRFRSKSAFAMHTGTAPVPVWSGNSNRHRINPGGNRQLNAALHRIAVTQLRVAGPSRDYVDRRVANGHTKTEAIRALRRRLADVVYRLLLDDAVANHQPQELTEAA